MFGELASKAQGTLKASTGLVVLGSGANPPAGGSILSSAAYLNPTFNPSGGTTGSLASFYNNPSFISPSGQTVAAAYGDYISNTISSNVGTITSAYGLYIDTGSASAGTVTTHTGLYVNTPSGGTNKYTAIFTGGTPLVGIGTSSFEATNPFLQLGNSGTSSNIYLAFDAASNKDKDIIYYNAGTGSFIVGMPASTTNYEIRDFGSGLTRFAINSSGAFGFGTSSITSNEFIDIVPTGNYAAQLVLRGTSTTTTSFIGANDQVSLNSFTINRCPASTTVSNSIQCYLYNYVDISNASAVVTNARSLYVGAGAQSGGTGAGSSITNGYGVYVENPGIGTNKCALYTVNAAIGSYTGTTPPTNGLIVSGNVGFGTSSVTNLLTIGTVNTSLGEAIKINGNNTQNYMSFYNNATRQGYLGTNGGGVRIGYQQRYCRRDDCPSIWSK